MPLYPRVEGAKVLQFLETKGFARPEGESFSFSNPADSYSSIVGLDEEADFIDLNHLLQDWTVQGAGDLAKELIIWLGADPIA